MAWVSTLISAGTPVIAMTQTPLPCLQAASKLLPLLCWKNDSPVGSVQGFALAGASLKRRVAANRAGETLHVLSSSFPMSGFLSGG